MLRTVFSATDGIDGYHSSIPISLAHVPLDLKLVISIESLTPDLVYSDEVKNLSASVVDKCNGIDVIAR